MFCSRTQSLFTKRLQRNTVNTNRPIKTTETQNIYKRLSDCKTFSTTMKTHKLTPKIYKSTTDTSNYKETIIPMTTKRYGMSSAQTK